VGCNPAVKRSTSFSLLRLPTLSQSSTTFRLSFRKELPNGRVVIFTNADHHRFIDRENEVVREMREFFGKWRDD